MCALLHTLAARRVKMRMPPRKCPVPNPSFMGSKSVLGNMRLDGLTTASDVPWPYICVLSLTARFGLMCQSRWNYLETVFIPFFLKDTDIYGRQLPQAVQQAAARSICISNIGSCLQEKRGTFLQYNQARLLGMMGMPCDCAVYSL